MQILKFAISIYVYSDINANIILQVLSKIRKYHCHIIEYHRFISKYKIENIFDFSNIMIET